MLKQRGSLPYTPNNDLQPPVEVLEALNAKRRGDLGAAHNRYTPYRVTSSSSSSSDE